MTELTIGLLWHKFTSANQGVNALSYANAALIHEVAARLGVAANLKCIGTTPDIKGTVPVYPPGVPVKQVNVEGSKRLLLKPRYFREKISDCQVVFDISEGDSFTDLYGWQRFWRMYLTKARVVQQGIPLILAPQTIGPYKSPLHSAMARRVIKLCDHVFPRDELSLAWLTDRGLGGGATLATDVAFRLPFTRQGSPGEAGRTQIGINVSGLLFGGGYTRKNQFGLKVDYPALMRALLTRLTADRANEVWLVGHVNLDIPEAVEDDHRACRDMAEEFPGVHVAEAFASPVTVKSFISGLDFFVGSRMHATIAAFSSGVPVVPIGYSRKFTGLFHSLGYHWVADAREDDDAAVLQKVLEGLSRRSELREEVAAGGLEAHRRLKPYEECVERVLERVIRGS